MKDFQIHQVQKTKSLTNELAETLRYEITSGKLKKGEKLPSSKFIEENAGVSRSVVREAVAQLRAEGLVESKQGVGVFITSNSPASTFEIHSAEFESIQNAINILELRMAVETQTAAKAAQLRTDKQLERILECVERMENNKASGDDSSNADSDFHLAIADASANPYFSRFIKYLGSIIVPRRSLITEHMTAREQDKFFETIMDEHRHIIRAIKLQSPDMASAAMKAHLSSSIKRHMHVVEYLAKHT